MDEGADRAGPDGRAERPDEARTGPVTGDPGTSAGERRARRFRWAMPSSLVLVGIVVGVLVATASPTAPTTSQAAGSGRDGAPASPGQQGSGATTTTALATVPAIPPSTQPPPSTAPTTTAPLAATSGVLIRVTGTGQASLTVVDGANESQFNDVALPWTTTLTDTPSSVVVSAQSSDGSDSAGIACAVDVAGTSPVTDASTGPFATVSCATTPDE